MTSNNYSFQLEWLRRRQDLLYILMFSLVTIIIWVGVTLFRPDTSQRVDPRLQELALPLNPNLDTTTLDLVSESPYFAPEDLNDFPIFTILVEDQTRIVTLQEAEEELRRPEPATSITPELETLLLQPQATQSAIEAVL